MRKSIKKTTKNTASVLADVSIGLYVAGLATTVIATGAGLMSWGLEKAFPAVDETDKK